MSATLRQHRLSKGMSQQDLAKRIGVSTAAVSTWDRGSRYPRAKFIPRIARALNLDPMLLTRTLDNEDPERWDGAPRKES